MTARSGNRDPDWLRWARELQAIAQIGLTYSSENLFDRERYERIREIAAEIMAAGGSKDPAALLDLFRSENGYATPKVDVRGVVFDERGRLLLVRETSDGLWTLPGGWADVNESPARSVEREVREESGYVVRAVKLLAIFDRSLHGHEPPFPFHVYKFFVRCTLEGGTPQTSIETSGVDFFARDRLPPLSVSRVTAEQIDRMFEHFEHPDWATDLD